MAQAAKVRRFQSASQRAHELDRIRGMGVEVEHVARRVFDVREPACTQIVLLMEELRREDLPREERAGITLRVYDALSDASDRMHRLADMVMKAAHEAGPLYEDER